MTTATDAVRGLLDRSPTLTRIGITVLCCALGIALVPALGSATQFNISSWLIYGLLAVSLAFVWGKGGIFSLGQTVFFGLGAYAYGIVGMAGSNPAGGGLGAVLTGVALSAAVAAALGYFMFYGDLNPLAVAAITLASTLVLAAFMASTSGPQWSIAGVGLGGYNGLQAPPLQIAGTTLLGPDMLRLVIVVVGAVCLGLALFLRTATGRVVAAVASNPERARLLAYEPRRYQLLMFTVGGAVAGLAGTLFAVNNGIVTPDVFALSTAGPLIIWVLVGGRNSLIGALVGALAINYATTTIDTISFGGHTPFAGRTPLILGIVLVVVVLVMPNGLIPSVGAALRKLRRRYAATPPTEPPTPQTVRTLPDHIAEAYAQAEDLTAGEPILEATDVAKRYGGVHALDGVSLSIDFGHTRCLLGPNGAGKSTFLGLVAGRSKPTRGSLRFRGKDLTAMRQTTRVKHGIGIKTQVPSVFPDLTVRENLWLAARSRGISTRQADTETESLLVWALLAQEGDRTAGTLAHGGKQWLEVAMVIARVPRLILLDEPTAGMTAPETVRMAEVITVLTAHASVVVVEHDMDFIRRLGQPATLFVKGQVFMEGSLDELQNDERVLSAFLGRGH